jgi:two-component system cell cycle response regulator
MTARVLVVDDILANVKLLEARLAAEYFDVLTACSAQEALDICDRERVDVVLLDVMMPGMDGFEACRRLKSNPKTHHIPVVLVTALDQVSDKLRGLDGGADDFLTKPVDEIALVTRVKNLARLKMLTDEMLMRALTGRQTGIAEDVALMKALSEERARILVVDDDAGSARRLSE